MSLSSNIKSIRIKRGMTQEALAAALGVSAQAVSKWETTETYPDGSLLLPLANVLGTSLDLLFGNTEVSEEDLNAKLERLIGTTPESERMKRIYDLWLPIEKGALGGTPDYDLDLVKNGEYASHASFALNNHGFTYKCGKSRSFSVFPEPEGGYGSVIGDGEEMRRYFKCLSSPETMRAVLFLLKKERKYLFEDALLAEECAIPEDRLAEVIEDLVTLGIVSRQDIEIDGKPQTLLTYGPSHVMIALLLFAKELGYTGTYTLQSDSRSKPLITE